jgi:hypothetical protein
MATGGDWFEGAGSGAPLDVVKMADGLVGEGLWTLVGAGALVSLGLTSDGGALGVTVTVDGRWRREYFRDDETLLAWIAEAIPAVQSAKGHEAPSGGQRNGRRRARSL